MPDVRREDTRPASGRYVISVDGVDAGFTMFGQRDGIITFRHTEVDPAFEGQGIGSALARFALDDARARGLQVKALCPFIAAYLKRHPDYQDIVVP
jgi:predicted GNAT family acetyltransferase